MTTRERDGPRRDGWAALASRTAISLAAAAAMGVAVLAVLWIARPDGPGAPGKLDPMVAEQPGPTEAGRDPVPDETEPSGPGGRIALVPEPGESTATPTGGSRARQPVSGDTPSTEPQRIAREGTPAPEPAAPPAPNDAYGEDVLVGMAMPVYEPAYGTDPAARSAWVTRSVAPDGLQIAAAAPDHVTRTSTSQPPLHWLIDRVPDAGVFRLTIVDPEAEEILVDRALPWPEHPGVQHTNLAALGVSLPGDRTVRWSVAWREHPDAPPVAFDFGWLRVEPLPARHAEQIAAHPTPERIALYAEAGCFHEALEAALDTLARHPKDDRAQLVVDRLLEQAGMEVLRNGEG